MGLRTALICHDSGKTHLYRELWSQPGIHIYRDALLKYAQPLLTDNRPGYPFFLRATFHLLLYIRYRAQGASLAFESTGGQPPLESWR